MHIAFLNLRTILDTSSQCISMFRFYDYGIDISHLPEVGLPKSGGRRIQAPKTGASDWMCHSRPEDDETTP